MLPGLDRDMDEASWKQLDQSHPQFGLRELLAALGCERNEVADWPGGGGSARHLLITELMRPAETTEAWSRPPASSLEHVTRADCATPHQEALVVALALRETLKDEGRTAALVTPDRELARRVAAELGAGLSTSTIRPARRWPTRRRPPCCARWSRPSTRASRRSPCSPC